MKANGTLVIIGSAPARPLTGLPLHRGVVCCAVLCCVVLCCAVLCCAVLCCAVLCCAVLSSLGIQPPALAESGVVQKAAAREKSLLVQAALSLDHLTLQNNIKTLHGYFITRACMRYKFE